MMEYRPQMQILKIQTIERSPEKPARKNTRPICFFCHQEVDQELLLMVNNSLEEMVCICSKHFQPK